MKKIFVIGDIHGCAKTFEKMLEQINPAPEDKIFLLGDYVDRGPDSKGVVDKIFNLVEDGFDVAPIMGNHEYMLLSARYSPIDLMQWDRNGSYSTLKSFKAAKPEDIPRKYLDFFEDLPYYRQTDEFIISHASLDFEAEKPLEDIISLLWARGDRVDKEKTGGRRVICGHTPKTLSEIEQSLEKDKIFLDGGCVYKNKYPGVGFLCALELNDFELTAVENVDY